MQVNLGISYTAKHTNYFMHTDEALPRTFSIALGTFYLVIESCVLSQCVGGSEELKVCYGSYHPDNILDITW